MKKEKSENKIEQEAVVETQELKEKEIKQEKTLNDLPGVGPATVEKLQAVG